MPIRKSKPFRWSPKGCSDTLDSTELFVGAMASLSNLIPDPTTQNLWVSRPAALQKTDFTGFTTPGFVSCSKVFGDRVYGMVASARNAGKDEPFVYDLVAGAFVTVSNVLAGNVPTSPASTGAWTPPIIALIGTKITITHPGFSGANFVGWIDISNPAAPAWSAGNTAVNALPVVPSWVAQFNGRAYYGVNPPTGQPAVYATDVLDPTTITNATYILTFDDNQTLIAAAGLPLNNQLGGIIQGLIVFKQANAYQVTGDFASTTNPIAKNALNVAAGTLAPLSLVSTPKGLAFVSQDGLRLIDFNANMSDPVGVAGQGIVQPFAFALVPSRIAAACNGTTIRISTQNGALGNTPNQEWWYDIARGGIWSGPHTFPASTISAWNLSFIMTPVGVNASLWQSDSAPTSTSTYVENGSQLSFEYNTANWPDMQTMSTYVMMEAMIYAAYTAGDPPLFAAVQDAANVVIDSLYLPPVSGAASLWGTAIWGTSLWGGARQAMLPRKIDWSIPVVFSRAHVYFTGQCSGSMRIGDFYCRLSPLGYIPQGTEP